MNWASDSEFKIVKKYFPFSCVDLIVMTSNGYILIKRQDDPYRGLWHLPGGIIHKGQTMFQKANEVAERELGFKVNLLQFVGVFENLHQFRHDISHCFMVKPNDPKFEFLNTDGIKAFKKNPHNMIPYHKDIIRYAREKKFM